MTLEVSKLSGWLNAEADCRESKGGHPVRDEGAGQQTGATASAVQAACRRGARVQIRGRARGGAHLEHAVHVYDAGGVEAQRLVERRRGLPRVERRAYGAGRGCGPADGGDGVQRAVEARLQIGEQAWSAPGTSATCS
eukprot:scaffold82504_cov48-Phaeocystis_antarctica.AAC.2